MTFSKQQFLARSGLEPETLNVWLEERWLLPVQSPAGISFSDIDVARAQFIRDLQLDLGVNDEGVGVILDLVDQLHGMRRALEYLHKEFGKTSR